MHQAFGAIQPHHLGDSSFQERNSLPTDQSDGHTTTKTSVFNVVGNVDDKPPVGQ